MTEPVDTTAGGSRPAAWRKFARWESLIWSSLAGWLFRRPLPVPPGGQAFGYAKEVAPLLWGFIAVSALEIPLIDLLLPNWTLRIIFGLIGVWGLIWMCGLLAVQYRMPHVVGPDRVRIRAGWSLDLRIRWEQVDLVRPISRLVTSSKSVQYDGDAATGTRQLVVAVASRTNVTLTLRQRLEVDVDGTAQVIDGVRLWADDPAGFVAAARLRLETQTDSTRD